MYSVAFFCVIMLCILDLFLLYWIGVVNKNIKTYEKNESPICPVYFCDQYINPLNGSLEPGSLCYTNTTGVDSIMTAYRYTNSDNSEYQCQKYLISDNLILEDENYQ